MNNDYSIVVSTQVAEDQLEQLYSSVGWKAYTADIAGLGRAIANSSYVVTAWSQDQLVGLARGLSDDVSVFYLQDILVRPEWQHQGIGRALLNNCLERFEQVRQKVLLTDDLPEQHRFYVAAGFSDTRAISNLGLHTFVQLKGVQLVTENPKPSTTS